MNTGQSFLKDVYLKISLFNRTRQNYNNRHYCYINNIYLITDFNSMKLPLLLLVVGYVAVNGLKASELIKPALETVEGSGGGKAEMAQGAGKAPQKIAEALRKLTSQLP